MRPRPQNHSSRGKKPAATCAQEVDLIARYLSSDLPRPELMAFESHLAVCRDCVAFLKTYKATMELTRDFWASQGQAHAKPELSFKREHPLAKRR